jgi:L-arabinonolactonase
MALREKGGAIVALRDGTYAFNFEDGKAELMVAIDEMNPRTRLNDGKVDRRGRFFVGGMDEEETGRMAELYRFETDHSLVKLEDGILCFNMPCWSPDDKIFYAAETWEDVFAYDYDIETGQSRISAPSLTCGTTRAGRMARRWMRRASFGMHR